MIAGVDGTSRGWVVLTCDERLRHTMARFLARLEDLPRTLRVAAVDIPIGLPERGPRDADRLARRALGEPRRRSVFPSPLRCVAGARSWADACAEGERADGRRVSRQTFGLLPKIVEADALVRGASWARRILHEVHPELSFATWARSPMVHSKKTAAGRSERQQLIAAVFGPRAFAAAWTSLRGSGVGADDLADAFAAAWTASRIARGRARRLPEAPAVDAEGVPMHIWA